MSDMIEIRVPDIGDFDGVEIIEVLVDIGDPVQVEDSLITIESDKASMEIPCPQEGMVREMKVKVGDRVSQGDVILLLEKSQTAALPADETTENDRRSNQRIQDPTSFRSHTTGSGLV
ncbi:MAG: biotin/lipoyl-containing protein [Thiolinea sp.]